MKFDDFNEKEKILLLIVSSGGDCFDPDLLTFLGIDKETLIKYLKNFKKKGLIKLQKIQHHEYVQNLNKVNELKLIWRIFTFICRKKECMVSELISRYGLDSSWLKLHSKKWEKEKKIVLKKFKDKQKKLKDLKIFSTERLKEYLKNFLRGEINDDFMKELNKNKVEAIHFTPEIIGLIEELKDIVRFEGKKD